MPELPTGPPSTRARHWLPPLALALFAAWLALACDDGDGDLDAQDSDPEIHEITVRDDAIDPTQLSLRVPDTGELVVVNEGAQACSFHLGPWVRDFTVEPGETRSIQFTVSPVEESPDDLIPMGCEGDERSGTIEVLEPLRPGGTEADRPQ